MISVRGVARAATAGGLALVCVVLIASTPCLAAPVVFSATDFGDSLWDVTVVCAAGAGGAASGWQVENAGHGGAYRRNRISVNAGGPAYVWAFHCCLPFTYDPNVQGAVASVDYAAYLIGLPGAHNTGPAIRQDGVGYAVTDLLAEDATWTLKSFSDLTEQDFRVIGGTAHPDFSASGSAFYLGYITGYSTPSSQHGAYDMDTGIDNWTFTVHPVPEPAALSLLALGGAVEMARRKRRK